MLARERMIRFLTVGFLATLVSCDAATRQKQSSAVQLFSLALDRSSDPPTLTISCTEDHLDELKSRYTSFSIELGQLTNDVQRAVTQGYDGSLKVPWTIQLKDFKSPYPVRVIGTTKNGTQEIVVERTY